MILRCVKSAVPFLRCLLSAALVCAIQRRLAERVKVPANCIVLYVAKAVCMEGKAHRIAAWASVLISHRFLTARSAHSRTNVSSGRAGRGAGSGFNDAFEHTATSAPSLTDLNRHGTGARWATRRLAAGTSEMRFPRLPHA